MTRSQTQNADNRATSKEIFIYNFLFISWKNKGGYNNKVMISSA